MYGKIVNGELIEAPKELVSDDGTIISNFNRSIEQMLLYKFKPVIDTKPHYDINTQYCIFAGYDDGIGYIRFKWVVEDIELSEAEIQNQQARKAMELLNINFNEQIQTLSDEMALEVPSVFPKWEAGVRYVTGFKVLYNDILYKVLQEHDSQEDWAPDLTPSLFARVIVGGVNPDTGEQEIPEWIQPDSTNPYMMGDKVLFNGVVYESAIDNNIWAPDVYPQGWKTVEEE